jgi:hypothetical protein
MFLHDLDDLHDERTPLPAGDVEAPCSLVCLAGGGDGGIDIGGGALGDGGNDFAGGWRKIKMVRKMDRSDAGW